MIIPVQRNQTWQLSSCVVLDWHSLREVRTTLSGSRQFTVIVGGMVVSARGGVVLRQMAGIALREKADNDQCDLPLYTQVGVGNSADRVGGSSRLGNILWPSSCLEKKKKLLISSIIR